MRPELRTEHRHPPRDFRFWDAQQAEEAAAAQRLPVRDGTRLEHRGPERCAAGPGRPTEEAAGYPDQPDVPVAVAAFPVRFWRPEPTVAEMPDAPEAVLSKALPPRLSGAYSRGLRDRTPGSESE